MNVVNLFRRPTRVLALIGLVVALVPSGSAATKINESLLQNFPFQGACISAQFPPGNTAMKGLAIRLGTSGASVLFDTDLCRIAAGWTGGYIDTHGVAWDGDHGGHPSIVGEQVFGTARVAGVALAKQSFADPGKNGFGPMDAGVARWNGLHISGNDVQLNYAVAGRTTVQEQPSAIIRDGQTAFVRTFQLEAPLSGFPFRVRKVQKAFSLLLADVPGAEGSADGRSATLTSNGRTTHVALVGGAPRGLKLAAADGRVSLQVARATKVRAPFKVVIWTSSAADDGRFKDVLASAPVFNDFSKGGPGRWAQSVETRGILGKDDAAYTVDTITPPIDNPWKRRVRIGGFDFFSDGTRAAVCTWDGDIWIVSGLDKQLHNLTWRRFASGMYETLGLRIIDDVIYTSGRDQITRYHDLNNDGEADYYENFNNAFTSTEGFHEFVFDLQTDKEGNFYFAKAGPVKGGGRGWETISANAGTLMKVSRDGKKLEVVATGFRAPNGIGVNPWNGQITTGDNEGTWVPTCPVNWVTPGGFYGVEDLAQGFDVKSFKQPLLWMSHDEYDNSGGGQAWVNSDTWGPFQGRLLHLSYGQCALYLVMYEQAASGQMQGGVVKFPLKFASSAMRGRFNPRDGQLYVAGLQGWQTKAVKISGFDRVRYTGKPVYTVEALKVTPTGLQLTFSTPLDAKEANDPENFSARRWNYRRTSNYGSPTFSVKSPEKQGRDRVAVKSARLLADGKTVEIDIDDFRPVNQMEIKFSLKAADGTEISQEFQCTVNVIPGSVAVR
jgi:hypothetical protein